MSKTVFITGGSRGIGAGVARRFAAAGYNAAVGYCASKGRAEALCAELSKLGARAMPVYADVTNLAGLERAAAAVEKNLGAVDVLVAAAGIAHYGLITDITEEEFDELVAVNLKGVFLASRAVAPYMVGRKSGSIVTVSSIWGITGASCEAAYSASKAGVIGFTKALSKELAPSNITVNCIAPGAVETDILASLDPEARARLIAETPLGRIGSPADIAEAALYLAEASFVTGQVLSPNGGIVI